MKRKTYIWVAIATTLGITIGFFVSQYLSLLSEFPNTMLLKSVILKACRDQPSTVPSALLDVYEAQVDRQNVWYRIPRLDWNQELIQLALLRYVVYSDANHQDLAEQALARASSLRRGRKATQEEIEFERQVARKVFRP